MNICIIGNGKNALENHNGKFIDSCDLVVRMKQYVISGYEQCVGTKIDIYVSKWFSWFETAPPYSPLDMSHVSNVDEYWFMFCDPEDVIDTDIDYAKMYLEYSFKCDNALKDLTIYKHKKYINDFNIEYSKVKYYSIDHIEQLSQALKLPATAISDKKGTAVIIEPSVGLRTIYKAVNLFPNDMIYITGFDCFLESSWYWDDSHIINNDHKYLSERIFLNNLINTGQVYEL